MASVILWAVPTCYIDKQFILVLGYSIVNMTLVASTYTCLDCPRCFWPPLSYHTSQ